MSERDRRLLWDGVRLAVLDIETVWNSAAFTGPARVETDAAIEQVRATGKAVRLAPQKKAVRWRQHATIERAGLTSVSHGNEPTRAVEVMPAPDGRAEIEPQEAADTTGGENRAVWVAVVSCRRGEEPEEWQSLINPGVPVDPYTAEKHGLTNDQLRPAPTFARVADRLVEALTPGPGEFLVLVGHNVGYDIGVLRGEMRRLGRDLPDLSVLDTMGPLAGRVGKRSGVGLLDLLTDLGLPHPAPHHHADEDARATARAACALLDMAADNGDYDLPTLLGVLGKTTIASVPGFRPSRTPKPARIPRLVPTEHIEKHDLLAPGAGTRAVARWIAVADECAAKRCPGLAGDLDSTTAQSVEALGPGGDPAVLLDALTEVAERRAKRGDGAGLATALDAIGLVYDLACPVPLTRPGPRPEGQTWDGYPLRMEDTIIRWHRLRALMGATPRCSGAQSCPRCWDGEPCGRDELVRRMAVAGWTWGWDKGRLLFIRSLANLLPARGTSGWFSHRHEGKRGGGQSGNLAGSELADATLGWVLRTFRAFGDGEAQEKAVVWQMGRVMEAGGCGEPVFWEMLALELAKPGRVEDLAAAIRTCDEGLMHKPTETTASAWASLAMTRDVVELRRASAERGHEVRHHPGPQAKRPRELRFV